MHKFKFYFIVITASVLFFSCSKDDDVTVVPPVAYSVQYPIDIAIIKDYLTTHYIENVADPNLADKDVVIKKIDNGQASIFSLLDSPTYPKLLVKRIKLHNVDYELYYLVLREGKKDSPCNTDGVLAAYKGTYLKRTNETETTTSVTSTFFEEVKFPQTFLSLSSLITGWSEILPKFKTGETPIINKDGTVTHSDFGAGVMFLPSGLAYYNLGSSGIPAYAPLVFSFKLYAIQRLDSDGDGVLNFQEDMNDDDYMYDYRNTVNYPTPPDDNIRYADDNDRDGIPDFMDIDDDGDNYTTKFEIKNPTTNLPYPFVDIPTCISGKKNYLDATCHP